MSNIAQIMAECGCQHTQCETLGYCMAARIEELDAKLAKAVDALSEIAKPKVGPDFDWSEDESNRWRATWYRKYQDTARTTLAELTGEKS